MLLPDGHESHKGRNVSTVTFAAPIEINGTTGILAVVVKQTGKNRYKTHRILMPDGSMFTFDIRKAESTGSGVNIEGNVQGSDIDSAYKKALKPTFVPQIKRRSEQKHLPLIKIPHLRKIVKRKSKNPGKWRKLKENILSLQRTR